MYIIVGGGGDVGYYLTKTLLSQGHEVLLLEKNSSRVATLSEELGPAIIRGDACEARTLDEVGANRADLVICQVAKKRYKVGRTIARLNNPKHSEIFQKLGIDITVSPTKAILSLIESELPSSRFVPLMTLKSAGIEIIEVRVPTESPAVGRMLRDLNLPRTGNLALIIRDGQFITPTAETIIYPNDDVFALVNREGEEELRKTFGTVA